VLWFLLIRWKVEAIAKECSISARIVYSIQSNLLRYRSIRKLYFQTLNHSRRLSKADEEALFEYLLSQGWRQQEELVWMAYT
jgi:hypothetical protein